MSRQIEHTGIVNQIIGNQIRVLITQQSACGSCAAKGACSVSDTGTKIIEVESSNSSLRVGQEVTLIGNTTMGLLAVLLAFVFPFILILFSLFILSMFIKSEAIAGFISISMLVPYFTILSLFNKKISKKLQFKLKT